VKTEIKSQLLASVQTLQQCFDTCPDSEWQESHNDAPFSQVLFHTLFYLDFYLCPNVCAFKTQNFHVQNKEMFRDYEELEYKKAEQLYSKEEIKLYLDFCYDKINIFFEELTTDMYTKNSGHKNLNIFELLLDIMRHVQHHAAQLGLRIQQITGKELKWISQGK
jgi:hypothetical protein